MTDIFTGALATFAGPELVIRYPVESETGGDLDLLFWHVETGQDLYLRIQAKRLNAAVNGKSPVKIEHRSYKELLHKPNDSSDYQFETLLNEAPPALPLYMFYNHQSVVENPHFKGTEPIINGVNLAFATDIARELRDKIAAAPEQVKHHKRLNHLRKHMFGLEAILCPPGDWEGASVPPPAAVSASLREQWNLLSEEEREKDGEPYHRIWRILTEPAETSPRLHLRRHVVNGPSIRVDETIERPLITFISGRTDDDRTPIITDKVQSGER